jgi:hypothetical protein
MDDGHIGSSILATRRSVTGSPGPLGGGAGHVLRTTTLRGQTTFLQ